MMSLFDSPDTPYKQEYLELVKYYQEHPVKKHSWKECLQDPSLYSEKQHIIPQWFFKANGIPCDNSKENVVRVPFHVHMKMHILLAKHFEAVNDSENHACALYAVQLMMNKRGHYRLRDFDTLNKSDVEELQVMRSRANKLRSDYTKKMHQSGKLVPWRKFSKEFVDMVEREYNGNEDGFAAVSKFTDHFRDENHIRLFLWQHKRPRKFKEFALKGKPQKYTEEFIRQLHKMYVEHDDGITSPWFYLRKQKSFPISHLSNDRLLRLFDKYGLPCQKYDIKYGRCIKVDEIRNHNKSEG